MPTRTSIAAFILGLVAPLTACGSSTAGSADSPDPSSPPAGASSSSASPEPSKSPRPRRAKNATVIEGTGYSFALPRGWVDLTRRMRKAQPSLDVAVGDSVRTRGFASNLAVNVTPTPQTGSETLEAVAEQIRARVREDAPNYRILPQTEVAGLPAAHLAGIYRTGKQRYWLEQFVVIGETRTTVISFSLAPSSTPAQRRRLIDRVLDSWMIEA